MKEIRECMVLVCDLLSSSPLLSSFYSLYCYCMHTFNTEGAETMMLARRFSTVTCGEPIS